MSDMLRAAMALRRGIEDRTLGDELDYTLGAYHGGLYTVNVDPARRLVWITDPLGGKHTAYLHEGCGIPLYTVSQQVGTPVRARRVPGRTELEITGLARAAATGSSGMTPGEQSVAKIAYPALRQIAVLRVQSSKPTVSKSVEVSEAFFDYVDPTTGQQRMFGAGSLDFTTSIAALSSGQHQLAVVYLDPQTNTLLAATNTASSAAITPPYREAFQASDMSNLTIPAWGIPLARVYLYYGQVSIETDDILEHYDPRPLFRPPETGYASVTTTDATVTDIATIAVAELTAYTVTVRVIGTKSDYAASIGGTLTGTFRRATGGNVTAVGSVTAVLNEDSASAPTFTMAADTTNQTIDIRVTGVAAETWSWRVSYQVIRT